MQGESEETTLGVVSPSKLPTTNDQRWEMFPLLPLELQRSVLQELDFPTLANALSTCQVLSEQSELLWQITCLRAYPTAKKIAGFSWRWVVLSKQDIKVISSSFV